MEAHRVIDFLYEEQCPGWIFDFVFWGERTVIEINGGTYRGRNGGHSSGTGIKKGYFKNICVQSQGWKFFELDNAMVHDPEVIKLLYQIMVEVPAGLSVYPNPQGMLSYGNNKRDVNRQVAAEKTIAHMVQSRGLPKSGDFCFYATDAMKALRPYKKGRSKLMVTQVRLALDSLGFHKGAKSMGGKRKVAYFHTDESIALYDEKL